MLITKKAFSSLIQYTARWDWLVLILLTPFLLFPTPARTPALLVIPLLWLVVWIADGEPLVSTPLNGTLLLLSIMVLVSTWATYDIAFSLPKISGMVLGFGVFFALARAAQRPKGWMLSLIVFLGLGLGVAVLGLVGTHWFATKLSFLNPITERVPNLISGLQGAESGFHPNEIAGALTWVLPVLMVLSLSPSLRVGSGGWGVMVLLWLTTLFVATVFVLTQSRGGYIGLALTGVILLCIALPPRFRWALLGLIVIAGLILGVVLSKDELVNTRDWIIGSGLTTENALSLNTLEGRVEIWSRAIYGLQDFPFTGMGMNTFREVVHVLYPLFLVAPDVDLGHAHNEFLQVGLDLGIPGLIAFIALYLGALLMLFRLWRALPPNPQSLTPNSPTTTRHWQPTTGNLQRAAVLGLGGGLLAHLIYGLTDAVAMGAKPGVLFWMLLGLVAGLHRQICSCEREQDLA